MQIIMLSYIKLPANVAVKSEIDDEIDDCNSFMLGSLSVHAIFPQIYFSFQAKGGLGERVLSSPDLVAK